MGLIFLHDGIGFEIILKSSTFSWKIGEILKQRLQTFLGSSVARHAGTGDLLSLKRSQQVIHLKLDGKGWKIIFVSFWVF